MLQTGVESSEQSSLSALVKGIFLLISFYIYIIGYRECSMYKKNYCVSAHLVKSKVGDRKSRVARQ